MNEKTEMIISDFHSAAVLRALGKRLISARQAGRRVELVFDNADGTIPQLLQKHLCQGVEVNSLALINCLVQVKTLIFSVRRESGADRE